MKLCLKFAAFFEAGHFKAVKVVKAVFIIQTPPTKKICGLIKSFLCERYLLAAVQSCTALYLVYLKFHLLSQNCRNAATKSRKPCASWSPVLRATRHGLIDVALFGCVAGTQKCPNGCRNAAAHASHGRCGVADFWGRVRGNFFWAKDLKCRYGCGFAMCFSDVGLGLIDMRTRRRSKSTLSM